MKMKEQFRVTLKEGNFDIKEYEILHSNNCTTIALDIIERVKFGSYNM